MLTDANRGISLKPKQNGKQCRSWWDGLLWAMYWSAGLNRLKHLLWVCIRNTSLTGQAEEKIRRKHQRLDRRKDKRKHQRLNQSLLHKQLKTDQNGEKQSQTYQLCSSGRQGWGTEVKWSGFREKKEKCFFWLPLHLVLCINIYCSIYNSGVKSQVLITFIITLPFYVTISHNIAWTWQTSAKTLSN